MSTSTETLNVARSQLGYRESAGNRSKYGAWYGLDASPWCDMFVSWCAHMAGTDAQVGRFAYTPWHAAFFRERGQWSTQPIRGAIAFFTWPGAGRICHVGLVEDVRADAVVTIEGNTDTLGGRTGGQVMRHLRRAWITGYGHPAYLNPPPPAAETIAPGPNRAAAAAQQATLSVTGTPNWATWRALQAAVGLSGDALDGQPGPVTWRAVQRRLGFTGRDVDGIAGPVTWRAVQRRLGFSGRDVDGRPGPVTWRAVQRALRAGWRP